MSIQPFKNCFGLSVKDNGEKLSFFFFLNAFPTPWDPPKTVIFN